MHERVRVRDENVNTNCCGQRQTSCRVEYSQCNTSASDKTSFVWKYVVLWDLYAAFFTMIWWSFQISKVNSQFGIPSLMNEMITNSCHRRCSLRFTMLYKRHTYRLRARCWLSLHDGTLCLGQREIVYLCAMLCIFCVCSLLVRLYVWVSVLMNARTITSSTKRGRHKNPALMFVVVRCTYSIVSRSLVDRWCFVLALNGYIYVWYVICAL